MAAARRITPSAARRTLLLAALALGLLAASGVGRELLRESFTLDHLSSDWEVLLPVPDDVYPSGGVLRVVPAAAPEWGAHSRLPNLVRYRLPLAGAALEVRAEVEVAIDSVGHGGALVLYQDDQNWVELAFRGAAGPDGLERVLRLTRRAGGEEASVERRHGRGPAAAPETVGLVLERAGARFTGRMEIPMGPPGVVRKGRIGTVEAPGLGDLQLMLKALRAREPAPGEPEGVVRFDDVLAVGRSADADLGEAPETLRVTYATDFGDPTAFHREFSVLRPDPGSLVLEDGLELVARYGIPGDRWTPIRNLVVHNRLLPRGPFDVEVEVDARFTSRHDDVGIVLYGEEGNAIHLGHWSLPTGDPASRQAYPRVAAKESP